MPDGPVKQALLTLAIRPIQRANYFCAATLKKQQLKHYALNEPVYTHFTSPIRRYLDIIVRRRLDYALKSERFSRYTNQTMQDITCDFNYHNGRAARAYEHSTRLYLCRFLSQSPDPIIVSAIVLVVEPDFNDIFQPTYGLKNRLFIGDLPLGSVDYQSNENTVVWFWKRGVMVDLETHIRRRHRTPRKTRSDVKRRPLRAPLQKLIPSYIDVSNCTQTFSIFSTLDVNIGGDQLLKRSTKRPVHMQSDIESGKVLV